RPVKDLAIFDSGRPGGNIAARQNKTHNREAGTMDEAPFPSAGQQGTESAAEVLLRSLKSNGIDHLLVNPGTDFAPMIEGLVHSQRKNAAIPKTMVITHENCAVAMAHGYYMVTGKPQAVMVHTNVGTAK